MSDRDESVAYILKCIRVGTKYENNCEKRVCGSYVVYIERNSCVVVVEDLDRLMHF